MEKKLSDLTVVELKALAYDQVAQIEFCQNNLRVINQELSQRLQPQQGNIPPDGSPPIYEPLPQGSIQTA